MPAARLRARRLFWLALALAIALLVLAWLPSLPGNQDHAIWIPSQPAIQPTGTPVPGWWRALPETTSMHVP